MNLKEISASACNWVDSSKYNPLLQSPHPCGIELPGFVRQGVLQVCICYRRKPNRVFPLSTKLLISRSTDLRKITCISSLCSIDELTFLSFSIFSLLLQLSISSSVPQIIKKLCSSFYPFDFRHLSFNDITKEAILQNMAFLCRILLRSALVSPILSRNAHQLLSLAILSSSLSPSTTFQSSPNTSTPIFLVSRCLSNIKQYSKHNT